MLVLRPSSPVTLCILAKRLEIETPFQRTTIGNDIWSIKWSRDRFRYVTPKGAERQLRDILVTAWLLVS